VEGCAKCQQMKVNTHPTTPPLTPIKSEGECPFSPITTDFITDLLESDGYDSLMVMVDHGSTKGVIFIPCNKTIDALGAAMLLLDHIYKRFGLPDKIISDRDPRFTSTLPGAGKTTQNQAGHEHSLPPPDRWADWTCQPGSGNIPEDVLLKQPRHLEDAPPYCQIRHQPENPLHTEGITLLPHDGIQTQGNPNPLPSH